MVQKLILNLDSQDLWITGIFYLLGANLVTTQSDRHQSELNFTYLQSRNTDNSGHLIAWPLRLHTSGGKCLS